jgi:hypothetical protein
MDTISWEEIDDMSAEGEREMWRRYEVVRQWQDLILDKEGYEILEAKTEWIDHIEDSDRYMVQDMGGYYVEADV